MSCGKNDSCFCDSRCGFPGRGPRPESPLRRPGSFPPPARHEKRHMQVMLFQNLQNFGRVLVPPQ